MATSPEAGRAISATRSRSMAPACPGLTALPLGSVEERADMVAARIGAMRHSVCD
ncbi:hypothetical protein [Bosea sp. 685]|uniref:hypothetical protein n=1 Tax=Bosea sp. 685 TaxID=3080057 RepID=UPI0028931E23|nr:hypothetical protein [Bosea sp. 685]WNJ93887.1 hypothetical protein RMR04_10825 [Bosea sp. 685]